MSDNQRQILDAPKKNGVFTLPETFSTKDEVTWAKRRMDSVRVAQYADSKCGLPNTFDATGAYLCDDRKDGESSPCNKLAGTECLIRIQPIDDAAHQSCGFWETRNAGDPEGRYCPKGKLTDARISFGTTESDEGFGCERCEYGQQKLKTPDSEGRPRWCSLKGHPVEDKSCCADNEVVKGSYLQEILAKVQKDITDHTDVV